MPSKNTSAHPAVLATSVSVLQLLGFQLLEYKKKTPKVPSMNTPAHEAALALAADLLDSDHDAALDGEELLTFAGMRTYADVC